MKGISLPVNAIVIIALAIIVLLAVATWFSAEMLKGSKQVEAEQTWTKACNLWKVSDCDLNEFDNDPGGLGMTIKEACKNAKGSDSYNLCKSICCGE